MSQSSPRLACRAVIVEQERLLLVNAYPGTQSDLWCAPGGGALRGMSLQENLAREVYEETGLTISIGKLLGISEFHNTKDGFHQVDLFYSARIEKGALSDDWHDPDDVVNRRQFFSRDQMSGIRFKPDFLPRIAFSMVADVLYDPLEMIIT